jgi:hypothetical protein
MVYAEKDVTYCRWIKAFLGSIVDVLKGVPNLPRCAVESLDYSGKFSFDWLPVQGGSRLPEVAPANAFVATGSSSEHAGERRVVVSVSYHRVDAWELLDRSASAKIKAFNGLSVLLLWHFTPTVVSALSSFDC